MKNIPLLIATLVGSLLLIIGISVAFSNAVDPQQTANIDQTVLTEGARHQKGASEAEITIVEFSDFQCPACAGARIALDQALAAYPDQVEVVYRHFPLESIHPLARLMAAASEVAAEQGKFWEFHDLVYEQQASWSSLSFSELEEQLVVYFEQLELDTEQLSERIVSDEIQQRVQADISLAAQLRLNSTPSIFINGVETSARDLLTDITALLEPSDE